MKDQSCNNFCHICRCNLILSFYMYDDFKCRVSTGLFEISNWAGVEKCPLVIWPQNLVFLREEMAASNRVWAKHATKIQNAAELLRYIMYWRVNFLALQNHPVAITCLPIAAEHFQLMSGLPHSENSGSYIPLFCNFNKFWNSVNRISLKNDCHALCDRSTSNEQQDNFAT